MDRNKDRDAEEWKQLKEKNVRFHGPSHQWPAHHTRSFQQILALGTRRFDTYYENLNNESSFKPGERLWKPAIKGRTQRLVATASRNVGSLHSEMKWRLDVEKIITERFELEIECPDPECRGRLWRSEIEVVPEAVGPVGASIEERREYRTACKCSAESRLENMQKIGLNKIFGDRADDLIMYGGEDASELRQRRPDRVYGLIQTKRFEGVLDQIFKAVKEQVFTVMDITPFDDRTDPIVLPFLILEAKTERGDSFGACERQTGLPIWKMLKIQEGLQERALKSVLEQGGPLVWFLCNRGEDWRVYGCYTDRARGDDHLSYNIHNLWSGRVDSTDGALQLLLIIDYIFDWARDLYRPGVYRLLESLSSDCFSDSRSITSDSGIYSLRHRGTQYEKSVSSDIVMLGQPLPKPQLADISTPQGYVPESSFQATSNLRPWEKFDVKEGIFRPLNMVENKFQCLKIRGGDEMRAVLESLVKIDCFGLRNGLPDPRNAWQALNLYPVIAQDSTIKLLEECWTGKRRRSVDKSLSNHSYFVAIYYDLHFTHDWRLSRVLTCLVLNKRALAELRYQTGYRKKLPPHQNKVVNAELFQDDNVIELVRDLQNTSISNDIIAATEKRTQIVAKTEESGVHFILIETGSPPDSSRRGQNFVNRVFRAHKSGFIEQKARYLLVSTKLIPTKVKPLPGTFVATQNEAYYAAPATKGSVQQALLKEEFILMIDQERREKAHSLVCIFRLGHVQEPPDLLYQLDIIASIIKTGRIYFVRYLEPPSTHDPHNDRCDGSYRYVTSQDGQRPSKKLRKKEDLTRNALEWYRRLLHRYKVERGEILPRSPLPLTDPFHGLCFEYIDSNCRSSCKPFSLRQEPETSITKSLSFASPAKDDSSAIEDDDQPQHDRDMPTEIQ